MLKTFLFISLFTSSYLLGAQELSTTNIPALLDDTSKVCTVEFSEGFIFRRGEYSSSKKGVQLAIHPDQISSEEVLRLPSKTEISVEYLRVEDTVLILGVKNSTVDYISFGGKSGIFSDSLTEVLSRGETPHAFLVAWLHNEARELSPQDLYSSTKGLVRLECKLASIKDIK